MKKEQISFFGDRQVASNFGYTHAERDKQEMCIVCKREDSNRITGVELEPFLDYYGHPNFKAFKCGTCGYSFHFST